MAPKPKRIALPGGGAGKITLQPRKKVANKTAFQKGKPNPHAFRKAEDNGGVPDIRINRSGKSPLAEQLLSKNVLIGLNNHAPDSIAERLELPKGSSWSQCMAAFLLRQAFTTDHWEAAMSLIARLTEQSQNNLLLEELESMRRQLAAGVGGDRTRMSLLFVESDGNGGIAPDAAQRIEEVKARTERGEDYSELVIDSRVIEAERAAAAAEAEAKAIEKRRPKALMLGTD